MSSSHKAPLQRHDSSKEQKKQPSAATRKSKIDLRYCRRQRTSLFKTSTAVESSSIARCSPSKLTFLGILSLVSFAVVAVAFSFVANFLPLYVPTLPPDACSALKTTEGPVASPLVASILTADYSLTYEAEVVDQSKIEFKLDVVSWSSNDTLGGQARLATPVQLVVFGTSCVSVV